MNLMNRTNKFISLMKYKQSKVGMLTGIVIKLEYT